MRNLREVALRLAAAVVALVVLFGVFRAGASYVYCPAMERVSDTPCCGDDRHPHSRNDVPEINRADCCERHVVAKLPAASGNDAPALSLTAPLLAVLPPVSARTETNAFEPPTNTLYESRAGPVLRSRDRAELMVYLN